ncbi:MAG: isoaspartyl peptidase/L-asparaginase family protein [Candidatus Gracilibacteria bacterium]
MKYSLIIHGGCGQVNKFTKTQQKAFLKSLKTIISAGGKYLKKGKSALETVEYCVQLLEDDPLYNAGRGSVLSNKGKVEMDASIMDGSNLKAGAVAGISKIKNPVSLARQVMDQTPHVLIIGQEAMEFAKKMKAPKKPVSYFITAKREKQLLDAKKKGYFGLDHGSKTGTVGAVAMDSNGNIAAATSTGGMVNKRYGRVGDSALIGCGTYADNQTCGISCTGIGEDFIRTSLAKHTSDLILHKGYTAKKAATEAIKHFKKRISGYGGIIMIDHKGKPAEAFSTEGMIRAWVEEGSKPVCKLF